MKGTRTAPSCGFSARTVELLDTLLQDYSTVDVLSHPEVREGIKEFSSWPTIPQLYVRGEFIGGADIVGEMFESGKLHECLGLTGPDATPPNIEITDAAANAFRGFLEGSDEIILLEIDREFQAGLSIGPRPKSALFAQVAGLTIAVDRLSAGRAEGLQIDYVQTPQGSAFRMNNPNEPPKVRPLSVQGLKRKLDEKEELRLIDVRRLDEWNKARIDGAELLDEDLKEELRSLPRDTPLVFQCHHGMRSMRAATEFCADGFSEVYNLTGGIDAWSQEIDPAVPRY
jgi:monothiol glutaredoxin